MNQQNIQWTKIQVRQTIGALGIFLSVLILQIFAAVITLALSKVTGITPNSPNYVMFVSMLSAFMAAVFLLALHLRYGRQSFRESFSSIQM